MTHCQISSEPGFGAYQSLAEKIKVPFFGTLSSFCSFEGSRAMSKPTPNPGRHQTPIETVSNIDFRTLTRFLTSHIGGVAKGCGLSNGRSRSYREIKLLLSAGK